MKKLFILILLCLNTSVAIGSCPLAELFNERGRFARAWKSYEACALNNDSESQFFIGQVYLEGTESIAQNLRYALKFFTMASENGYAPAQRELAKLMDILNDLGVEGKNAIQEAEKLRQKKSSEETVAMTALSWMMLAAERADNKWFYKAKPLMDEEANRLLPAMKAKYGNDEVNRSSALATQWKQKQLLKQAKALLNERAYRQFENIIYPSKLEPPKMSQEQAVEELKKLKMSKSK